MKTPFIPFKYVDIDNTVRTAAMLVTENELIQFNLDNNNMPKDAVDAQFFQKYLIDNNSNINLDKLILQDEIKTELLYPNSISLDRVNSILFDENLSFQSFMNAYIQHIQLNYSK